MNQLDEDDLEVLKKIIEREKAASLIWKWFVAFLYVAVPLATLYAFYKTLGGQP